MSVSDRWADLQPRLLSAAVMIVVGGFAVIAGGAVFLVLVLAACAGMMWELSRLTAPEPKPGLDIAMALLAPLSLLLWTAIQAPQVAWAMLAVPALLLIATPRRDRGIIGLYALGVMVACAGFLLLRNTGPIALLWLVLVVIASDTLGYFAGRILGGPKFWPRISPKKTWSGTVAGWIGASLVGLAFARWTNMPPLLLYLSPLVALAGQFGDIMESWIKRRAGVKDASALIPGHGGLLDRFDALLGAMLGRADRRSLDGGLGLNMRRISVFGATGSVGENTFDLLMRQGGPDAFHTVALSGARNVTRLAEMAIALRAEVAVTADPYRLPDLRDALRGSGIHAAAGPQALDEAATRPADWVMSAIVGAAGLRPGLLALQQGATLALANKESLVTAGPLMMATAAASRGRILPVDSEHSAIFQALTGEDIAAVERIILTASGGALRDWPMEQLARATLAEALAHPNWSMGQRITLDSASMFNKALEVIETREFFGVDPDQIEVIIHPELLVHSLVGYRDGALMAHLGAPDMRHAIGYALNWPQRAALPVARLDLAAIGALTFRSPDLSRYPALRLAREVMAVRGLAGAAFNAAKEVALDLFIAGRIGFMDMAGLVEATLARISAETSLGKAASGLEDVIAMDNLARIRAREAQG